MQLLTVRRGGAILILALALTTVLAGTVQGRAQDSTKPKPQVLLTEGDEWAMDTESKTPQTLKDLAQKCPEFWFTLKEEKQADYFLLLEHSPESATAPAKYKFSLYDKNGRSLATPPAGGLEDAIIGACQSLRDDPVKP
jgi:hypothetical protein